MADFPISATNRLELPPAVAYNTSSKEYLVVWTQMTDTGIFKFWQVRGQRISQGGTLLGDSFIIVDNGGFKPSVAYNPDLNEYCVVAEEYPNTVIRVVTADGQVKDKPKVDILSFTHPQVLYNTIDETYLLVGIEITEVTPGSDQCHRRISAFKFFQPVDLIFSYIPVREIEELSDNLCTAAEGIAIDFAPITRPSTPNGRYLIALGDRPSFLKMLDHAGQPICVVHDRAGSCVSDVVPFQQSKVGTSHSVDVSFGYWHDEPVFLVVWADSEAKIDVPNYPSWNSGIVGGIVDAEKDYFVTGGEVSNDTFPISWIAGHYDTTEHANSWLPKAVYNSETKKFVVVWRETPTNHQLNNATVDHIRGAGVSSVAIPPEEGNFVLSKAISAAAPIAPAVVASASVKYCLAVWQDHRTAAAL
jgi:hypothetical protein